MKQYLDPIDLEAMRGCETDPLELGSKQLYEFVAEIAHILYEHFQRRTRYGVHGLKYSDNIPVGYIQMMRNRFYFALDAGRDNAEHVIKRLHKADRTSCNIACIKCLSSDEIAPPRRVKTRQCGVSWMTDVLEEEILLRGGIQNAN